MRRIRTRKQRERRTKFLQNILTIATKIREIITGRPATTPPSTPTSSPPSTPPSTPPSSPPSTPPSSPPPSPPSTPPSSPPSSPPSTPPPSPPSTPPRPTVVDDTFLSLNLTFHDVHILVLVYVFVAFYLVTRTNTADCAHIQNMCGEIAGKMSVEKILESRDSGNVEPTDLFADMDSRILKAKDEALSRRYVLDRVEQWMRACEEESWLEDHARDDNRYNASRGARINLKQAEKARIMVNTIPATVENLLAKTRAWEEERGINMLAMLDKYVMLSPEREEIQNMCGEIAGKMNVEKILESSDSGNLDDTILKRIETDTRLELKENIYLTAEPTDLIADMDSRILMAKVEALSRKYILDWVEEWMSTCEEESWLEDHARDDNRYNSSRGARINLKQAEKARIMVNTIPATVEKWMTLSVCSRVVTVHQEADLQSQIKKCMQDASFLDNVSKAK